jgi:NAD(P)-dependent dehydrogenase (short-subunit alcohol dehydrogenase family)
MKDVLITGAGRGLGLAFAQECLQRGDRVFACVRNPNLAQALHDLRADNPKRLYIIPMEIAYVGSIEAAKMLISYETHKLDLLINNAGVNAKSLSPNNPTQHLQLGQLNPQAMLEMFHLNAVAPLMVAQTFLDMLMVSSAPRLVNISSWLGSIGGKNSGGNYSYSASKAALNMLTRALALDAQPSGLIAIAVNPGWVKTDMGGAKADLTPEQSVRGILNVVDNLTPEMNGGFYDWQGQVCPW